MDGTIVYLLHFLVVSVFCYDLCVVFAASISFFMNVLYDVNAILVLFLGTLMSVFISVMRCYAVIIISWMKQLFLDCLNTLFLCVFVSIFVNAILFELILILVCKL